MEDYIQQQQCRGREREAALSYFDQELRRSLDSEPGQAVWHGTQRDLVEMIALVAARRTICDERGVPLSMNRLGERAFRAIGRTMPHHLSKVVYRIRNRMDHSLGIVERWLRLNHQSTDNPIYPSYHNL